MSDTDQFYQAPGDAARRLDVSPSGLRRYASFYEELYGELPKDNQGRRLWPNEAVERLEAAKALMAAGRAQSIKDALEALERGVAAPVEALTVTVPRDALRLLLEEMQSMSVRLEALERLEAKVETLQRQLDAPRDDAAHERETARMNRYLLGELERRRLEGEAQEAARPWWRFWGSK